MKDIIICDLDGTLANCEHRVHHVQKLNGLGLRKKPDWDAFYAGVKHDTVHDTIRDLLVRYVATHHIIFCTGRPRRCYTDTTEWLFWKADFHPAVYSLYMRADGDFRADYIVKQEMLDNLIDKSRVLFVLDDRQQVVDMWRRNGLTCLQVAAGNF
jgi:hypothetical protein